MLPLIRGGPSTRGSTRYRQPGHCRSTDLYQEDLPYFPLHLQHASVMVSAARRQVRAERRVRISVQT